MAMSPTKLTLMAFPQSWDGTALKANIVVLPHENPLAPFTTGLPAGVDSPAFAEASLRFAARVIASLEHMPAPANTSLVKPLTTTPPSEALGLFNQLAASFKITKPSNVVNPVDSSTLIQKYLPHSYRNAFAFSQPRTRYAKTDDSYHCAIKEKDRSLPRPVYSTDDISWGKAIALALRQPVLARTLGLVYEVEIPLAPDSLDEGGWLYFDLEPSSDYHQQRLLQPDLVKRYACKLPALSAPRSLFGAVQFPVSDAPVAGNYDLVFIEAEDYDDGFAKIVHSLQPVSANLLLEPGQEGDGLPPSRDFGIRLGWDDEQLLIWQNRQMSVDPDTLTKLDAPMGVFTYRVDVKNHGEPESEWNSLMKATGDLRLNGIEIGNFKGELGIEVAPNQLDGQKRGIFWLPSYYTQWTGGSLIIKDEKAAKLAMTDSILKRQLIPVDDTKKPLLYGQSYDFRVRFTDISGGGPAEKDLPINGGEAPVATCHFRRLVPPRKVTVPLLAAPPDPYVQPETYPIFRPRLGYPSLLYTGLPDAFDLLMTDLPAAITEKREVGHPDPDVTHLQIEVEVKAPEMDVLLSGNQREAYYRLFSTTRKFPDDLQAPLDLGLAFHDAAVIRFGDASDLGDLPITLNDDGSPLNLPRGRRIRIKISALCRPDAALAYFGSQEVRTGPSVTIDAWKDSSDERNLFVNESAARQFQSILLRPDPTPSANLAAFQRLFGQPEATPANLFQRLAEQLALDSSAMSLFGKPGERVVFGCSNRIRHTLSPEHASISFANKTDLTGQWICALILDINRDWSWRSLDTVSFEVTKNQTELVGTIELKDTVSLVACNGADRSRIRLVFFDSVDPNSFSGAFPEPTEVAYTVKPIFRQAPTQKDADKTLTMRLPVATPPRQTPKLTAAGIALSDYLKDPDYKSSQPRKKVLWVEFEEPVADPQDAFFVFVKAYAPDSLLLEGDQPVDDPKEKLPFLPDEWIRVVTAGQPDDQAGLNAWQRLIPAKPNPDGDPVRHFIIPLPPGLNAASEELFGFFTCEFCVGHADVWSTAQARFGRPIRVTGVQHPAPQLVCSAERTTQLITVSAPYASPVFNGVALMPFTPRTEIWGLLYVQVVQADAMESRNILLGQKRMQYNPKRSNFKQRKTSLPKYGLCGWSQAEVRQLLINLGLPEESPLSALAVEMIPNFHPATNPLSTDLGSTRIYRTSPLTPIAEICL